MTLQSAWVQTICGKRVTMMRCPSLGADAGHLLDHRVEAVAEAQFVELAAQGGHHPAGYLMAHERGVEVPGPADGQSLGRGHAVEATRHTAPSSRSQRPSAGRRDPTALYWSNINPYGRSDWRSTSGSTCRGLFPHRWPEGGAGKDCDDGQLVDSAYWPAQVSPPPSGPTMWNSR